MSNKTDERLQNWNSIRLIFLASLSTKRVRAEIILGQDIPCEFWEHEGAVFIAPQDQWAQDVFGSPLKSTLFVLRTDGTLYPTKKVRSLTRSLRLNIWNSLLELRENPLHFITHQGRETGRCVMCGLTLTNPESIARGIGPVCGGRLDKILTPKSTQGQMSMLEEFK